MRAPCAVGSTHMFSWGIIASEKRISLPVPRSCTYTCPVFPPWITTSTILPSLSLACVRIGGLTASRSHTSCAMYWKCHLYLPVARSIATIESVYRLSPGRSVPYRSGEGLPATKNTVLVLRSTAGVIHTPPPSVW